MGSKKLPEMGLVLEPLAPHLRGRADGNTSFLRGCRVGLGGCKYAQQKKGSDTYSTQSHLTPVRLQNLVTGHLGRYFWRPTWLRKCIEYQFHYKNSSRGSLFEPNLARLGAFQSSKGGRNLLKSNQKSAQKFIIFRTPSGEAVSN